MSWPVSLLVAAPYFSADVMAALRAVPRSSFRLMIDSGAFTVHTQKRHIEHDDYLRFLDSLAPVAPFDAIQLDVIGDPAATRRNFEAAIGRGHKVLPVVTAGASDQDVAFAFDSSDYVLFGGIVGAPDRDGSIRWFAERAPRGKRMHWLGFTSLPFIARYRPYSVDSSSWAGSHRFGVFPIYVGGFKFRNFTRDDVMAGRPWLRSALLGLGFNLRHFQGLKHHAAWRGKAYRPGVQPPRALATFVSTVSWVAYAHAVEQAFGTHYTLACTAKDAVNIVLRAHAHWRRVCVHREAA